MKRSAKHLLWTSAATLGMTACLNLPDANPHDPPFDDLVPAARTSAALLAYESCAELEDDMKDHLKGEMRAQLLMQQNYGGWGMEEDALAGSDGNGSSDESSGSREEGVDFSGTNNQEEGVDEADFVKTDGYHIYVLNNGRLEIFGVPTFGDLIYESSTEVEGYPQQMLFAGDKIAVFSQIYGWNLDPEDPLFDLINVESEDGRYYRSQNLTKVTVFDVTDRHSPRVARELFLEGYYQTGRKVDETIRLISYGWLNIPDLRSWPELNEEYYRLDYEDPRREDMWNLAVHRTIVRNNRVIDGLSLGDLVPNIYERRAETIATHLLSETGCTNFAYRPWVYFDFFHGPART